MVDIIRAYASPDKYRTTLPVERIVADEKIEERGVSRYQEFLGQGNEVKPIIVIKHPKKDLYAVLDGHHRFWALKRMGMAEIPAVVVDVYTNLGFEMTRKGYFQPSPLFTKYVRIPLKKFTKYMKTFLWNTQKLLGRL
ncbi:MAG: ParB/RepB/Spo0J family partition protein [Thermoplasmata archaeon]